VKVTAEIGVKDVYLQSGISLGAAFRQAEPVNEVAIVSTIIPCLDEGTAMGQVVTAVLAQNVSKVIVIDGGWRDLTVERAKAARSGRALPKCAMTLTFWFPSTRRQRPRGIHP
jgi:hypothetical protein